MTIAGNLRTMSLADMLQWLSSSSKTGTLVVDGPDFTKRIFFRAGDVVAVSSDNPREMLGYYLVGWGFCTEEDLRYMIEMQDHFKVMLGELVVKLGHMTKDEFDHLLLVKTMETIYDLILWEEGEFRFIEAELPDRDFLEVKLPVTSFLFEGYRQRDERLRMHAVISDPGCIPVLVAPPVDLDSKEQELAMLMDGRRSMEDIALESRVPIFDVMSLSYRFVKSGIMQIQPPEGDRQVPGQSDAPWIDAAKEVDDKLQRERFLDAFKILAAVKDKFADHPGAQHWVEGMLGQLQVELDKRPIRSTAILEPAVTLDDLVNLECDPAEGFVLSRINGHYAMEEVLAQLPGARLQNRVIIHNLHRRGLIKVRDATSVRRYRQGPVDESYLEIDGNADDPFR
jgi:hypothetical protein